MPQSNDNPSSGTGSVASQPKERKMSQLQMVREAGFTSFNQFLLSYGLKIYDYDDVEEGKLILKALFEKRN